MTSIEWTDKTWNPIVGCSVLSPGCTNCYAMRQAARLEKMLPQKNGEPNRYAATTKPSKAGPVWTGSLNRAPESVWLEPIKRRKPTTYFVNSMGDLFHENVPDEWLDRVFAVIMLCPQHRFQVLTKRSRRMRQYLRKRGTCIPVEWRDVAQRMGYEDPGALPHPLPNLWLGVSAEDQLRADERIPDLLATPAAVRFLSAEPLLGTIDLRSSKGGTLWAGGQRGCSGTHLHTGHAFQTIHSVFHAFDPEQPHHHHDDRCNPGLDWIIVGGESGTGARPMIIGWAEQIVQQCCEAGVAVFVKQLGPRPFNETKGEWHKVSDRKGAIMDEWPLELRVREMPELR